MIDFIEQDCGGNLGPKHIAPSAAMVLVIVLTSIALPATWRKRRGRPVSRCTTQVRRTSSPAWPLWLLITVTGRRQESDGPAGSTRIPPVSPRLPTRRRPSSRPSTTGGRPVGTRRRETRRASCPRRGHCAFSALRHRGEPARRQVVGEHPRSRLR